MLDLRCRLHLKHDEIVAKVMDGEAVIIDLASGIYYSSDKIGGAIWGMIERGLRLDEIASAIAERHDVGIERVQRDVARIAEELLAAELLEIDPGDGASASPPAPEGGALLPYAAPQIRAYHDMEELLALDPPTPVLSDIAWKE